MSAIEDRIAAVVEDHTWGTGPGHEDECWCGLSFGKPAAHASHVAAAVVAELQLREEWTLYNLAGAQKPCGSRAAAEDHYRTKTRGDGPLASRVVSGWEKAE